jgi:hypothetical protein
MLYGEILMTDEESDSDNQPSTNGGKMVEVKTTGKTTQTTTNPTPASQTIVTETETTETTTQTPAAPKPAAPSPSVQSIHHISPMMGVRLAWALTGGFVKLSAVPEDKTNSTAQEGSSSKSSVDKNSIQTNTSKAETILQGFLTIATAKETPADVKEELLESITAIQMSVRNLGTIYNGRELNFQQNDKLREAYLTSITEDITFGDSIRDYAKTLPSIIVAGGGGLGISIIAQQYLGFAIRDPDILIIAILCAVLGFFASWIIRKWGFGKKIRQFMWQDQERNIYYEQYLNRASVELTNLYQVLSGIKKKCPVGTLPDLSDGEKKELKNLLTSLYPTTCDSVATCLYHWLYAPIIWTQCETCGSSTQENSSKKRDPKTCPDKPWGPRLKSLASHGITPAPLLLILICIVLVSAAFFVFTGPTSSLAGISFIKSVNISQIIVNKTATVLVTFENNGPGTISDLTITDKISGDFALVTKNVTVNISSLKSGESRSVQYLITPGKSGKYILDPAKAQYVNSAGTVITIESTSPKIEVLPVQPESTPDPAAYNTSEFYSSVGKITSSFLPNATG